MNRVLAWLLLLPCFCTAAAQNSALLPKELQDIGIQQRLNQQIPLDTVFQDEAGKTVQLRQYFGARPVLLVPVYYTCPMLCSQILSGVVGGLRPLDLRPGVDFEIVAFSFNPAETPAQALEKRNLYAARYSRTAGTNGWHFLTGSEASIRALTEAIGFHFRYDPATKMFLHASGVMVLTPEGKLSRYFYGVEYEPNDLRLGIIESSERKISSPVAQILLFCYHYDPVKGKYGATVMNLLHAAGILTIILMAAVLFWFWRADLRRYRLDSQTGAR